MGITTVKHMALWVFIGFFTLLGLDSLFNFCKGCDGRKDFQFIDCIGFTGTVLTTNGDSPYKFGEWSLGQHMRRPEKVWTV